MNDPRAPHGPFLHATRALSWPYRPTASTFGRRVRLPSPPFPPLTPFHHDTPSPLASPGLVIEQARSGGFRSPPLPSADTLAFISRLFFPPANRRKYYLRCISQIIAVSRLM
ncbi:hypothetical protein PUN28_000750 [Cardiocondyla obscurior]|uniref:Uncharacterized protein n=1 Tax=Cardiocondyla obscurior TaxID=286306 RepID=A0AAW2H0X8_9HYME